MKLSEIQNIYNSLGSRQSEISAYQWLIEQKQNNDGQVNFVPNNLLLPGKIHTFRYNPKHKKVLDYYDKNPVVLYIGTIRRGKNILELGINLNFIPVPYKWYVLATVTKTYSGFFNQISNSAKPKSALKQPNIRYNYNALKSMLERFGFTFAIRTYIPSRKSNTYVINYSNWEQVALLSIDDFEKITYSELIKLYKNR